jgi:soluble lytic murein transglycosylase
MVASPPLAMPPASDMQRLREGINAAADNQWAQLRAARAGANDALIQRILTWRLMSDRDAPSAFAELDRALTELDGWPGRDTMRRKAEQAIIDSGLSAAERVAWLQRWGGPLSGDGRVYLAQALRQTGDQTAAAALIKETWRTNTMSARAESAARAGFSDVLTGADHAARLDRALWLEDRSVGRPMAERVMPLASADQRKLAQARIALQTPPRRGLQRIVEAVPASLADHPGLIFDRIRYIRRDRRPNDAIPLSNQLAAMEIPAYARERVVEVQRAFVPAALRAGDGARAYRLMSRHGLSSGERFAEAEFLSGWLALRYLRQPQTALTHFERLGARVSSPVSRSRALYWRAQALRAAGREDEAAAALREAAQWGFTFYGQLAAVRSDPNAKLNFDEPARPSDEEVRAFHNRELVRALRLVAAVGDQRDFEAIAFFLDDQMENPVEHEMLSQIAREQRYWRTALRSAKAGQFRGILAPASAYPLITLPERATGAGAPEPALTLAIIRQESEFDTKARSRANARGLMQLIPGTARAQARAEGLPFQLGWLTEDPEYNITLGSAHLADLIDHWNGSYVLAIASYNAGAGNARDWIDDWGDPRRSNADVVDWIELIPFSETRNYLHRVLENLQAYRHRLAGAPTPLLIERDLRRGAN